MARSSVVIFFDNDQRRFLVGKESSWVTNIRLDDDDLKTIDRLFSRKIHHDPDQHRHAEERAYYKSQLHEFKRSRVMDKIKPLAEHLPPRITFGDIKYKKKRGQLYSYTIPQFLPAGSKPNFPAGGSNHLNGSLKDTAVREFFEETGIDLKKEPFDISKLIDTGLEGSGYRIFVYEPTEAEFLEACANITSKNLNGYAELHDLEFISTKTKIATHARKQFAKFTKKTRHSKQRWRRTLRERD